MLTDQTPLLVLEVVLHKKLATLKIETLHEPDAVHSGSLKILIVE